MIRRAEKRDIPELLRLLLQVNNVHAEGRPDLFIKDRTKYSAEELEEVLGRDIIFVETEDDEKIAGYAFCEPERCSGEGNLTARSELYIDDICVDESCRRNHTGKRLYEHVKTFARENGFSRITLNVWSLNPGAEGFYRAMGMRVFKLGMEEIIEDN